MKRKVFFWMWPLIFSIVVAFPIILPYFNSGYFSTHDGEWAVVRLGEMFRELRDMQIPPRYSENLNFGYGYPLFNFVYPFPYYLGTFIHLLGFGFVDSIKILFAASVPLSAFFMFLTSRILWKSAWAGVISAVMYVYFPYRMVDLYVRGSIGESLSFALFPLLFYLAIKLIEKPSYLWILPTSISIGVLITTHNIMTVLFLPLYIVFILIQAVFLNKKTIKTFFLSIFLGFGLSAFFWIPAIFEKSNILLSQIPIADRNLYFVTFEQFIFPRWGYGVPIDKNGFSYQVGIPHLVTLVLAIFVLLLTIRHSGEPRQTRRLQNLGPAFLLTSVILIFIFLLFKPSDLLWRNLPFLSEINYPWIALGVLGFLVSLLAGFLCREKWTRYIVIFLGLISVVLVLPYAKPQYYVNRGDGYYLTNDDTTTSSNELMPLWVKKNPSERTAEKIEIVDGEGRIENVSYSSKQISFSVALLSQNTVRINTIYYPGWNAFAYSFPCHPDPSTDGEGSQDSSSRQVGTHNDNNCEGKELAINYQNEKGVMELQLPKGERRIELRFTETPIRLMSDIISLLSLGILIFLAVCQVPNFLDSYSQS